MNSHLWVFLGSLTCCTGGLGALRLVFADHPCFDGWEANLLSLLVVIVLSTGGLSFSYSFAHGLMAWFLLGIGTGAVGFGLIELVLWLVKHRRA